MLSGLYEHETTDSVHSGRHSPSLPHLPQPSALCWAAAAANKPGFVSGGKIQPNATDLSEWSRPRDVRWLLLLAACCCLLLPAAGCSWLLLLPCALLAAASAADLERWWQSGEHVEVCVCVCVCVCVASRVTAGSPPATRAKRSKAIAPEQTNGARESLLATVAIPVLPLIVP